MAAHHRTAPESVSPSTSQPPPARMIGPSSTYFDPTMNLQRGVELELQFYNQMQQQQQQQQQAQAQVQQQQYAQSQWQQQQQQLQYPQQQQQYQQTAYPQTPVSQEHYPPLQSYNLSPVGQYGAGSQLPEPTYQQPTTNGTHQDVRKEPGSASKRNRNRKRRRSQDSSSSDSEDGKPARPQGACTHCKKLKMKCEFFDDEDTCRRCKASGHKCIVEGRKPRNAPNKREYLLAQIRHKDRTIAVLLKQVHDQAPTAATAAAGTGPANAASPPSTSSFNPSQPDYESEQSESILRWLERSRTATGGEQHIDISITAPEGNDQGPLLSLPPEPTPVGLMANLAIRDTSNKSASSNGDPEENSDGEVGIARSDYFMNPGMDAKRLAPDDQMRPGILVKGIVNFEEVDELFEIFFSRLNVVLTVLDPVLHTPASTFAKCPFLFTVVCATASRYYTKRPELYTIAMHFAREAAGNGLTHSHKSIELCQAYIIMATYGLPAKRWEEDRNWLYIGMAIRIATDLNLHVPLKAPAHGPTEQQERETVNRTRVWLICFNLDRSTSTQFGKMSTLREGFIVRNSANWYRSNRMCSKYDIHLCAYTALLRIMARFIDEVFSDENSYTGLNTNMDWVELCDRYNSDMDNYVAEWAHRFATESDPTDPSCVYRTHLLPFVTSYARLVMHSFGFQHAIDRGTAESKLFFKRCLDAAKENCTTLLEKLAKTTYLRYAPDGHFVFASFATAFLIKMLRPEYKHLLDQPERDGVVTLVTRVVDVLGSRDISIDDKHTPKLYSRFLASLLGRQQAADKEARGRSRRGGTTTPKSGTHSPARGSTHSAQASIEELPPTVLPPLFIPAASNTHAMVQPQPLPQPALLAPVPANVPHHHHQQHADGLLHVDLYSDAGTELTIEQRPEEVPADEMLAGMHALSNPAWWDHAMMPGFSWPQPPQVDSPVFSRQQQFGMGFAQPLQQGMQVMLPQGQQPTYMLR